MLKGFQGHLMARCKKSYSLVILKHCIPKFRTGCVRQFPALAENSTLIGYSFLSCF